MLDLDSIFGPSTLVVVAQPRTSVGGVNVGTHNDAGDPPRSSEMNPCPGCGKAMDVSRRCWRCHYRACTRCGRNTGTAFIELCIACDFSADGEG